LQIYRTCYVELKSSGALVKYRSQNSTHGMFYDLSRVRLVNYLPLKPTDQQQDFTVEFDNSDMLVCHFTSGPYRKVKAVIQVLNEYPSQSYGCRLPYGGSQATQASTSRLNPSQ